MTEAEQDDDQRFEKACELAHAAAGAMHLSGTDPAMIVMALLCEAAAVARAYLDDLTFAKILHESAKAALAASAIKKGVH